MRKTLIFFCALLASIGIRAQISAFPFTEDFENFSSCGGSCGTACNLSGGWENPSVGDDIDWTTDQGGTSSTGTGPSVDHNPGTSSGNYLYTEASSPCTNSSAYLLSPWFDFSAINLPKLEFWFHMFGLDMGTMHLDVDTTRGTGPWLLDVVPSWTGNENVWQKRTAYLSVLANMDSVRFRVRGMTGTGYESDMAVDNFTVSATPDTDLGVVAISSPTSGCGLTNAEVVEVCFQNQGAQTLNSGTAIPVSYSLNGGSPVTETLTLSANLAALDSICYTFTTTADLSMPGNYSLQAWSALAGDSLQSNDSMMVQLQSIPLISNFPYQEGFENGPGGWRQNGTNSSWAFGQPTSGYIPAAANGVNAWVTNLGGAYNNNELSFLTSPCLDFSSMTIDPTLRFSHIFTTESCCDEGWVDYSTDGGQTWTKLGASGQGSNWYNDSGNQWWDGNSGASGAWRTAEITMTGLAGQSSVLIRFVFSSDVSVTQDGFGVDDILIFDTLDDAAVNTFFSPTSGCGLGSAEAVSIEVGNLGTATINDLIVCYSINGGASVCDTLSSLNFAAGTTFSHTFSQTANLSVSGYYNIMAWTSLVGEDFPSNDTLSTVVGSVPTIASFPYSEDFEANAGFWTGGGSNSTWQWGTPAGQALGPNMPCGGNGAWATNLTGPYNNSENSFMLSPCMNFSSLTNDPTIRFDLAFRTESCCDEGWLESSTDGGTTWNKVGTSGTGQNWYNDASNQWWDGTNGGWISAENVLTGTAGQSDVLVRFVFSSDGSVTEEGFAVDNILIFDSLVDMQGTALISPASSCGLTGAEQVTASFFNSGTAPISSFSVCYSVNGGAATCENVTQVVAPGSTYVHTFTTTANLAASGDYDIFVYPVAPGDSLNCQDTIRRRVTNVVEVNTFPYLERFENGSGGWRPGGTPLSWELGTPAKAVIQGAASGQNAWVSGTLTGGYVANEDNFLLGPCFNFSNLPANPWVAMNIWWDTEFSWDGTNLQYSLDSGITWVNVGNDGDPFNWYNDNTIGADPGGQAEGWTGSTQDAFGSGGWVSAKHPLDTAVFNGQSYVLFRLAFASDGSIQRDGFAMDDFVIAEPPVLSLGPDTTVCGGFVLSSGYSTGTFEWSTGDSLPDLVLTNLGTSNLVDTISLIYTDTFGLCAFDTLIMTVQPAPQPDLGPDQILCPGGSITLDAGTGDTYAWSSGGTAQTETVSAGGTYTVTVTNTTTGCSNTDEIVITQAPSVAVSADTAICANGTATLTATLSGASFVWSNGDTLATTTVTQPGTYTVTATDANNCVTTGDILVSQAPDPSADFSVTANGLDYDFSDLSTGSPTAWAWDFGDGTGTSTQQNPSYTYQANGTYTVTLVVSNDCGSDTMTQSVTVVSRDGAFAGANITVYPNPSNGFFRISLEGIQADEISLELRDLLGRVRWVKDNVPNRRKLDLEVSDIESGIWMLRVFTKDSERIVKVVVE